MSSTLVRSDVEVPGGPMSVDELRFCRALRSVAQAVLDGNIRFGPAIAAIQRDMKEIRKHDFSVDAAIAAGYSFWVTDSSTVANSSKVAAIPSKAEAEFLRDLDGFLDFALRNGLTFMSVLSGAMHDIQAIAAHGCSLELAVSEDYFRPKVSGWAQRNLEPVGDSIEPLA